jgi:hypothetical protein
LTLDLDDRPLQFVKTDQYIQINGFWDGTKVNIPYGDSGGELDPHGAENVGNPIGGNVTSNVSGQDVFYEEWMSFVSYDQFCIIEYLGPRFDGGDL